MLQQYELCIYGDMHTVTNSFFFKSAKNSDTLAVCCDLLFYTFLLFSAHLTSDGAVEKIT